MQESGVEHDSQNGFKKGTRTTDNMFLLSTLVDQAKAKNEEL